MICDYILKKKENKNSICGLLVACIFVLNLLCQISGLAAYKPGGMIVFHSYSDYNAGDSRISTKSGKEGGYDLYLVNVKSGGMISLSNFNSHINTPMEELGCDYFES